MNLTYSRCWHVLLRRDVIVPLQHGDMCAGAHAEDIRSETEKSLAKLIPTGRVLSPGGAGHGQDTGYLRRLCILLVLWKSIRCARRTDFYVWVASL